MTQKRLKRNERGFRTELQRGAAARGFHVVKIPDSGMSQRFGVKKIYDLGLYEGLIYHAIELKEVASPDWALPVLALEKHQEVNLKDAHEKGGFPWVICRFRLIPGPTRQREFGNKPIREVWAVPLRAYLAARDVEQRDSLALEWWRAHGTRLEAFQIEGVDKNGHPKKEKAWDPTPIHNIAQNYRQALAAVLIKTQLSGIPG